jgi:hypothetical protein
MPEPRPLDVWLAPENPSKFNEFETTPGPLQVNAIDNATTRRADPGAGVDAGRMRALTREDS